MSRKMCAMRKRTIVYVDGFNLYYGLLKKTKWRWLDLARFADALAGEEMEVINIRYFTARIKPQDNHDRGPNSQKYYLDALLGSDPRIVIEEGFYLFSKKTMKNANPPPPYVSVIKSEEKGTDVNIACAMLCDAFRHTADAFVLISGDSDLATPVKLINDMGMNIKVANPQPRGCKALQSVASTYISIWRDFPRRFQLPDVCHDRTGRVIRKPAHW